MSSTSLNYFIMTSMFHLGSWYDSSSNIRLSCYQELTPVEVEVTDRPLRTSLKTNSVDLPTTSVGHPSPVSTTIYRMLRVSCRGILNRMVFASSSYCLFVRVIFVCIIIRHVACPLVRSPVPLSTLWHCPWISNLT